MTIALCGTTSLRFGRACLTLSSNTMSHDRPAAPRTNVVHVRVTVADKAKLVALAKAEDIDLTAVIRRWIRTAPMPEATPV